MQRSVGDVLYRDFIVKYCASLNELALALMVHPNRLSEIIRGIRGVSIDTDLRLCKYFGLKEGYFWDLQVRQERESCKEKIEEELEKIIPCLRK